MKSRTVFYNLLVFFFLTGMTHTAAAQEWSVDLYDAYLEDPTGSLDHNRAESVEFMPDGKTTVTAGWYYNGTTKNSIGIVYLRDAVDGSIKVALKGTVRSYSAISRSGALAVSPDGKLIAAAGNIGLMGGCAIDLFDPKAQILVRTFAGGVGRFSCVKFSPDSKMLAVVRWPAGIVELWDPKNGNMISNSKTGNHKVGTIEFSQDGKILVTGNENGSFSFWNLQTAVKIGHIPVQPDVDSFGDIALSPNGKLFASCFQRTRTIETRVQAEDRFKGEKKKKAPLQKIQSPVGGSSICLWKITRDKQNKITVKKQALLSGHKDHTYELTFSPDSKILVSASQDTTLKVWDTLTNKKIVTITNHRDFVYDVAFSADGKKLVSLSRDSLKMWNVGERMPKK